MRLVAIQRGGTIQAEIPALPAEADGVLAATAQLYDVVGFEPPWICYVAVTNSVTVGTCGFKAPPQDRRVEIAYFTFPGYEGKGIATQMARQLIALARAADGDVTIAAQTLPARNASHRVLEKLGFACVGPVEHPEDGTVLEWQKADRVAQQTHAARREA
jgi:RimJ/RimL family protein N-acetyltransferase